MSIVSVIGAVLMVTVAAVLSSAAVSDWMTRHISDAHWVLMCAVGIPLEAGLMWADAGVGTAVLYLMGSALLAVYMLSERLSGVRAVPVVVCALALLMIPGVRTTCILVMFFLFLVLYRVGILVGGADTKCLMSISLVLPVIPDIPGIPIHWNSPIVPVFTILAVALVLSLAWPLSVLVRNIRSGSFDRRMLSSYDIRTADADPVKVWPVEEWTDDGLRPCRASPLRSGDIIEDCRRRGVPTVRVTPVIPFILPVALSFALVSVLGAPVI